ncbi:hypothetical protein [Rhizobium halophytocola]|uniref:Transmembrane protein n=1 Tax=Rhizobium halophytocola TaxID=735519 RepID=A0ABS4DUJ9_9HYPH|nr:hypothetical protein [Rhizobium halophytocola]MBP1849375.1 hypothetical protein [Rhizobium halophytocola]
MKTRSLARWKFRYAVVMWIGILANFAFVLPLFFCPVWFLGLFGVIVNQLFWVRLAAGLLGLVSIFYIPSILDVDRYRVIAWMAVFPSRTFGALYCFLQVFAFGEPMGYFAGALLDGTFGLLALLCLLKITRIEQQLREGAHP